MAEHDIDANDYHQALHTRAETVQYRRFRRQVSISNQLALFAILATACYQVVYLATDPAYYRGILLTNLFFMLVYALGISLNNRQHHIPARNLVMLNAVVHIFFVNLFIGSEAGVHLFYFGLGTLLPFQYYPTRPVRYTVQMALLTLAYLVCHFMLNEQTALTPVPSPIVEVLYAGSAAGLVCLLAVTLFLFGKSIEESEQLLTRLSTTDQLTGLANRRHMDTFLEGVWGLAQRNRQPLSILMCDVDHFKWFNDTHGHPAGDQCLTQVARVIESLVRRQTDLVARYGGEEFIIILPQTELYGAQQKAEQIRRAVEALNIMNKGCTPPSPVTISVGVATLTELFGLKREDLLKMVDEALYTAKSNGRNRVETAPPIP
ncbi:GGDEF domain-containing protein [Saccharospirillum salsuginis]|uniref:diguanylate cyclase n=1 Tax=Saccharospirillum salsuginis TaxID=418750 RepID=A0A918KHD1_9GAMM|nr:GGDEF domain-containing protein [Saccharospirillum salsuginis]GGX63956.1 hypothetical protein GCM10007392_34520 [Saccharospirillum salsuginis]